MKRSSGQGGTNNVSHPAETQAKSSFQQRNNTSASNNANNSSAAVGLNHRHGGSSLDRVMVSAAQSHAAQQQAKQAAAANQKSSTVKAGNASLRQARGSRDAIVGGLGGRTGYHQQPAASAMGQNSSTNAPGSTTQKSSAYQGSSGGPTIKTPSSVSSSTTSGSIMGGMGSSSGGGSNQERKCDSCKYRTPMSQCTTFRCKDCGTYIICDYCCEDYMEKGNSHASNDLAINKKIQCVYCWSKHTLTDICVKTLKNLGFVSHKGGSTKIGIQTLTRDKIKKLSNLRVIQKTLVYVIGIAPEIASESKLKSVEYFGQYGNLQKVVVNTKDVYNATRGGPSYSAYLTFGSARESAIAILSVDQFVLNDRMIRASFGTSKFCQFFLNAQRCSNKDCLYLHELRSDLEAYTKEDMQNNKFIFLEQQKIAIKLSKALELTTDEFKNYNLERNEAMRLATEKAKQTRVPIKTVLPEPERIYSKDFHFLDEPLINRQLKKDASKTNSISKKSDEEIEESKEEKAEKANPDSSTPTNDTLSLSTEQIQQSDSKNQGESSSSLGGGQSLVKSKASTLKTSKTSTGKSGVASTSVEIVPETTKQNSMMPIFTNQKDVSNQERKKSTHRVPTKSGSTQNTDGVRQPENSQNKQPGVSTGQKTQQTLPRKNTGEGLAQVFAQVKAQNTSATLSVMDNKKLPKIASQLGENARVPYDPFKTSPIVQKQAVIQQNTATIDKTPQSNKVGEVQNKPVIVSEQPNTSSSLQTDEQSDRVKKKDLKQIKKKKIVVVEQKYSQLLNNADPQGLPSGGEANITKVDISGPIASQVSPNLIKSAKTADLVQNATPSTTPATNMTSTSVTNSSTDPISSSKRQITSKVSEIVTHSHQTSRQTPNPFNQKPIQGTSNSVQPNSPQQTTNQIKGTVSTSSLQFAPKQDLRSFEEPLQTAVGGSAGKEKGLALTKKPENGLNQSQGVVNLGKLGFGSGSSMEDLNEGKKKNVHFLGYRTTSRFQFAHSVDPIKKEAGGSVGELNQLDQLNLGENGNNSEVDKDEILVPKKIQEIISRSIRTLSNSISNRSPEEAQAGIAEESKLRSMSNSLQPVAEIEAELENRWYTLEEQAREQMSSSVNNTHSSLTNTTNLTSTQFGAGNTSPTLEDLKNQQNSNQSAMNIGNEVTMHSTSTQQVNPFRSLQSHQTRRQQQAAEKEKEFVNNSYAMSSSSGVHGHGVGIGSNNLDVKRVKYYQRGGVQGISTASGHGEEAPHHTSESSDAANAREAQLRMTKQPQRSRQGFTDRQSRQQPPFNR